VADLGADLVNGWMERVRRLNLRALEALEALYARQGEDDEASDL
jgi:hypothetical protein